MLNMKEYLEQSGRTASDIEIKETSEFPSHIHLLIALLNFVGEGSVADVTKRKLFYNESTEAGAKRFEGMIDENTKLHKMLHEMLANPKDGGYPKLTAQQIDLIHACLGLFSEASETLQEVIASFVEKREVDVGNKTKS